MDGADLMYADVRFKRNKARDHPPSPDDTTYSEVQDLRATETFCAKCSAEATQDKPGGSKVTSERLILQVLMAVLAAASISLGVAVVLLITNKPGNQQSEALRRNISAGWELHGGSCYYFSSYRSSWNQSRDFCRALGGDLLKIDSREEQMFLVGKLKGIIQNKEDGFWIGLTDSETEGAWLWVDGSPLDQSLTFWGKNQPDGVGGGPSSEVNCVRMKKIENSDSVMWFDRYCGALQRSICEKAAEAQLCLCV